MTYRVVKMWEHVDSDWRTQLRKELDDDSNSEDPSESGDSRDEDLA